MAIEKKQGKILKEKYSKQENSKSLEFPIVGIGASAGGLEALEQFFLNMPKATGIAFVVIQHLAPNNISTSAEIIQQTTSMKVLQASDCLLVEPNHIYVIPPNKSMSILNGTLHLSESIEAHGIRLPIDFFFSSLAIDRKEKSIGIILSGMGSDGSMGVKAIKEKSGLVVVQNPDNAKFDSMPRSAMRAVFVDIIADANDLPTKLITLLKNNSSITSKLENETQINTNLEKIIILINTKTGHDFSNYKKSTMMRRIERRINVHQLGKIEKYIQFLQENPNEIDFLFKELLIGVTSFFRNPAVWQKLKDTVLPSFFEKLPNGHVLRAWIPGCSTGEEAYSLAIVFREALEQMPQNKNLTLQIFATDIDKNAIEIGRKGVFPANILADVSADRIRKFFVTHSDGYRVNHTIREMVIFATHSIIKDPPFTKIDFLSCRNLLIYMETEMQKNILGLFQYSLNADGILLLGSAENESSNNARFTVIDKKLKFYKHSENKATKSINDYPSSFFENHPKKISNVQNFKFVDSIKALIDKLLFQRFALASVLINDQGDILNTTGKIEKYLDQATGKTNINVFALAPQELGPDLIRAVGKAKQNYEAVVIRNKKIATNGSTSFFDVTIQQIEKPEPISGMILIVFSDVSTVIKSVKSKTGNQALNFREQELEIELHRINEELQSFKEKMQTSQEELKSTNEELQSANEELQSTYEELTTSKEELQSMNEVLQTLNTEMQNKISEYIESSNDMQNLLNSINIPTLFIDKELNILRFTEQITKIIKLRQSDIARPFTEMVSDLQYPEIENDAKEVLRTLVFKETDISANDERWFKVRIMPYRTFNDYINGVVITFIDITESKKREEELTNANEMLKAAAAK